MKTQKILMKEVNSMGNLTLQQIATGIGIIVAILTPIIGIYKAYKKNVQDKFEQINKTIEKQQNEIEILKKESTINKSENILLIKSVQACLKGLKEQGCNGPVTEAITNIDEYLLKASH
jgi:tyrosine-protein phosphatase YwqE